MNRFIIYIGMACTLLLSAQYSIGFSIEHELLKQQPDYARIMAIVAQQKATEIYIKNCPLIAYITLKLVRKRSSHEAEKLYALLKALLQKKYAVNAQDTNGYSPLMYAAWYGNFEISELLCIYSADATLLSADHKTALQLAQEGRKSARSPAEHAEYTQIIDLLVKQLRR